MRGIIQENRLTDKPWVAIAAGGILIIVAACAVAVLAGIFGSPAGEAAPGTDGGTTPSGEKMPAHAAAYSGVPGALSYDVVMTTGYELGDTPVPEKGVFIRVVYRGGYAGIWTSGNTTADLNNSGERVIEIEDPGSYIEAGLVKLDSSARQPMTVEIWKDGSRRAANSTSLPYGEVTVTADL